MTTELYAIKVQNGVYTYLLGMYLGNVKEDEKVLPLRDYHPTLGKAIIFKSKHEAETAAMGLNLSQSSDEFEVITVDPDEDEYRIRYHW